MKKDKQITSARIAYRYARGVFKGLDQEELWVLFLNTCCNPIAFERMTVGGWTSTVIDFRQILANCLKHHATGMVIYHNHLSGCSYPSSKDIERTRDLKKICQIFEIHLIDHIIISDKEYYSFSDENITKIRYAKGR
jgi:DNA repair protein RadC